MRADITGELDAINGKVNSVSGAVQVISSHSRAQNAVFRRIPESMNEETR